MIKTSWLILRRENARDLISSLQLKTLWYLIAERHRYRRLMRCRHIGQLVPRIATEDIFGFRDKSDLTLERLQVETIRHCLWFHRLRARERPVYRRVSKKEKKQLWQTVLIRMAHRWREQKLQSYDPVLPFKVKLDNTARHLLATAVLHRYELMVIEWYNCPERKSLSHPPTIARIIELRGMVGALAVELAKWHPVPGSSNSTQSWVDAINDLAQVDRYQKIFN